MKTKKVILTIISIILILFLAYLTISMTVKYNRFKDHKDYYDLPKEDRNIESWMTLRMVKKQFDIDIHKELNEEKKLLDKRKTIEDYCGDKNLNTSEVIQQLEESRGNSKKSKKND